MATSSAAPLVPRTGARASASLPMLVLLAGWLVPGAGHLILGKWVRAALLFVSVLGMFLTGLSLTGEVYAPGGGDVLNILGFVGQLGLGMLYAIARLFSLGAPTIVNTYADWGTKFLIAGGLLNVIAAVDAMSLANGRKASY